MTSGRFSEPKRLTAGEDQPFCLEAGQIFPLPLMPPALLRKGSTPSFTPAKALSQFSFGKAAVVAKREEFASFLPSPPSPAFFLRVKNNNPGACLCLPFLPIPPALGESLPCISGAGCRDSAPKAAVAEWGTPVPQKGRTVCFLWPL